MQALTGSNWSLLSKVYKNSNGSSQSLQVQKSASTCALDKMPEKNLLDACLPVFCGLPALRQEERGQSLPRDPDLTANIKQSTKAKRKSLTFIPNLFSTSPIFSRRRSMIEHHVTFWSDPSVSEQKKDVSMEGLESKPNKIVADTKEQILSSQTKQENNCKTNLTAVQKCIKKSEEKLPPIEMKVKAPKSKARSISLLWLSKTKAKNSQQTQTALKVPEKQQKERKSNKAKSPSICTSVSKQQKTKSKDNIPIRTSKQDTKINSDCNGHSQKLPPLPYSRRSLPTARITIDTMSDVPGHTTLTRRSQQKPKCNKRIETKNISEGYSRSKVQTRNNGYGIATLSPSSIPKRALNGDNSRRQKQDNPNLVKNKALSSGPSVSIQPMSVSTPPTLPARICNNRLKTSIEPSRPVNARTPSSPKPSYHISKQTSSIPSPTPKFGQRMQARQSSDQIKKSSQKVSLSRSSSLCNKAERTPPHSKKNIDSFPKVTNRLHSTISTPAVKDKALIREKECKRQNSEKSSCLPIPKITLIPSPTSDKCYALSEDEGIVTNNIKHFEAMCAYDCRTARPEYSTVPRNLSKSMTRSGRNVSMIPKKLLTSPATQRRLLH